jgi:hypothetical protein
MASMIDKTGQQVITPPGLPHEQSLRLLVAKFVEQLVLYGYSHREISKEFGMTRQWVWERLRLANPRAAEDE